MKLYAGQVVKDIVGSEGVQTWNALRHVTVHGVCLAGTCLPVGEAGHSGSLEGRIDQWPHC